MTDDPQSLFSKKPSPTGYKKIKLPKLRDRDRALMAYNIDVLKRQQRFDV